MRVFREAMEVFEERFQGMSDQLIRHIAREDGALERLEQSLAILARKVEGLVEFQTSASAIWRVLSWMGAGIIALGAVISPFFDTLMKR